MKGKYPINSGRIDGMTLLGNKFPSLTKRQLNQTYALASKHGLSVEDIKGIEMNKPQAEIGESFDITLILNI